MSASVSRRKSGGSEAVAAAQIVTEALKRSGRELSRETLVEALEGLYRFPTVAGLMTFGPNRRIGKIGADVLLLNRETHRFVRPGQ